MLTKLISQLCLISVCGSAFGWTQNMPSNIKPFDHDTLTFLINPTNCSTDIEDAIEDAMELWNSAPDTRLVLKLGGTSAITPDNFDQPANTAEHIIGCSTNYATDAGISDQTSGAGTVGYVNGRLSQSFVILNFQTGTTGDMGVLSRDSKGVIIAHELGHAFGLGHSDNSAALMHYTFGKREMRLHQDDIDGVSFLYPKDELNGDPIMGCGFVKASPPSTGALIGLGAILLAVLTSFLGLRSSTQVRSFRASSSGAHFVVNSFYIDS